MPDKFSTMLSCLLAGLICTTSMAQPQSQDAVSTPIPTPTVWMCKGGMTRIAQSDDWPCTLESIDIIKLYIDEVKNAQQSDLIALVQLLDRHNIGIAIELAGLADWHADERDQSAERSFADEYAKVRKLTDPIDLGGAGGQVAILDFDGPIRRMLWPHNQNANHHTIGSATDELTEVMLLWQNAYPEIHVSLLTNFPNWGWKGDPAYNNRNLPPAEMGYGDYFNVLDMAVAKAQAASAPLASVTIDHPYGYATGTHKSNQSRIIEGIDWIARILDLESETKTRQLKVNLIFNSERGGHTSNALFAQESLEYIELYYAKGGAPDAAIVQSWYPHPTTIVPESTPDTMTNLTLRVARLLKPLKACDKTKIE